MHYSQKFDVSVVALFTSVEWLWLVSLNNLSSLTWRFFNFPSFSLSLHFEISECWRKRNVFLEVFSSFLAKTWGKEKRLWYAKVKALVKYCPPLLLPYFRRKFSLHKLWIQNFNLSPEVQVRPKWFRCKYQSIFKIGRPSKKYSKYQIKKSNIQYYSQ